MDSESFEKGRDALRAGDYKAAEHNFRDVYSSIDESHVLYNKIASYFGLAQVLIEDPNGLLLCRDVASSESKDGDVFLNLACAEWHSENRERAIDAIARGREIDGKHAQLERAGMLIDSREANVIPYLPRQHMLNRILGRLVRRTPFPLSAHNLLH